MLQIKKKIESVMHSNGKFPILSFASVLYVISIFYGGLQKLREMCYRKKLLTTRKLPCKVISVGNIAVGGTGKTPMTIHVARIIRQLGYKVVIISRGYKGVAERHGDIVSDGNTLYLDPELAGDEPYMIACLLKDVPVFVGKNRFAAGLLAVNKFQPDVIVLDDAFQHLKLKRDIDFILLDHARPFGNTYLLPRGILRETTASLSRATACILTRCEDCADDVGSTSMAAIKALLPGSPTFTSCHVPYCYTVKSGDRALFHMISDFPSPCDPDEIKTHKVFGFSGVARNDDFQSTVKGLGFNATGFLEFSDHHDYTGEDLKNILSSAQASGAHRLITTEKDYVRIAHQKFLPMELVVVGVEVSFGDHEQDFISFIIDRL